MNIQDQRELVKIERRNKIFKNLNGIGDCIFKNPCHQGISGLGVMLLFAQLLDELQDPKGKV